MKVMGIEIKTLSIKEYFDKIKTSMKESGFVFDCVHSLCCKCHKKIELWWIIYRSWIKKATINPINKKDDKCFQ